MSLAVLGVWPVSKRVKFRSRSLNNNTLCIGRLKPLDEALLLHLHIRVGINRASLVYSEC